MHLNPTQTRIVDFLAKGLKPSQVCSIVGVTASYVSQLRELEGFNEAVDRRAEELGKDKNNIAELEEQVLSDKYLAVEHKVLKQVEDSLSFAEFPMLVNALKVLGDRRVNMEKNKAIKSVGHGNNNGAGVNITILQLPQHALEHRVVAEQNSQGQITAINGRVLAPMSSAATKDLFKEITAKKLREKEMERLEVIEADGQQVLDF